MWRIGLCPWRARHSCCRFWIVMREYLALRRVAWWGMYRIGRSPCVSSMQKRCSSSCKGCSGLSALLSATGAVFKHGSNLLFVGVEFFNCRPQLVYHWRHAKHLVNAKGGERQRRQRGGYTSFILLSFIIENKTGLNNNTFRRGRGVAKWLNWKVPLVSVCMLTCTLSSGKNQAYHWISHRRGSCHGSQTPARRREERNPLIILPL